jgi:hypothetical protein
MNENYLLLIFASFCDWQTGRTHQKMKYGQRQIPIKNFNNQRRFRYLFDLFEQQDTVSSTSPNHSKSNSQNPPKKPKLYFF